ncbi:MAG: AAC(3) family N-acetyltransferase [Armatimonadetes bacterium]|nr:AAC(3) family N-acetyltransferase [Armatimonadota bacterium]
MALTKSDIVAGLREVGVRPGMVLMVHASLSALGRVEGGAVTVIEALIEALSPDGTLAMPAFAEPGEVFDVQTSPTTVGAIAEAFRTWPAVQRSLHPTHSLCALGPMAEELVAGHIQEATPFSHTSPWGKIARHRQGYFLLLGVDQNSNVLLHVAEDVVDAPYLTTVVADYRDPDTGEIRQKQISRFPQGHRDFLSLDSLFLDTGAMRKGKIGNAACSLIHAGKALELLILALRRDATAVLCSNPRCDDCLRHRAAIRRVKLSEECFTLAAVADEVSPGLQDLPWCLEVLARAGVRDVELGPAIMRALLENGEPAQLDVAEALADAQARLLSVAWFVPADDWRADAVTTLEPVLEVAQRLGARKLVLSPTPPATNPEEWSQEARQFLCGLRPAAEAAEVEILVENVPGTPLSTAAACAALFEALPEGTAKLAFNPAHFAQAGERPVLEALVKKKLKRYVGQLYVCDGCGPGAPLREDYVPVGQGEGQVKELISNLRARCFPGSICLRAGWGTGEAVFMAQAAAFWRLLESL